MLPYRLTALSLAAAVLFAGAASASSHREAPAITETPKVDGTDFYIFRSYEGGRSAFTTLIANYVPLQDSYGGPNYFFMDPDALYEIHVDNSGDSKEDLTFQFRFSNKFGQANIPSLGIVNGNITIDGNSVQVPLINIGGGTGANTGALNVTESYTVTLVRGDRRTGTASLLSNASGGATSFAKPVDNIGNKSIPDYPGYADKFVYNVTIPGCTGTGKLFVGQRRDGFVVNLGQIFDQINLNPLGARNSAGNTIGDKNVTSLALEVPTTCLTNGSDPVIGAWTTASLRQSRLLNPAPTGPVGNGTQRGPSVEGGAWTQVSRLGSPLVNEVVIGITDKDKFNASVPANDVANFGKYVLTPTLPVLVKVLFNVDPPPTPRNDLLAAFVTGVTTKVGSTANFKFTAPANLTVPGEMLRLNTAVGATAVADQKQLGFLDCDLAGFPNGRRPIDDVVDIALTVVEGRIDGFNGLQTCNVADGLPGTVVNPGAVVNDGAMPSAEDYLTAFPYLAHPLPGSVSAN